MGVAVHYHNITFATVVKVVASKHLKRILWIFRWEWWLGQVGLSHLVARLALQPCPGDIHCHVGPVHRVGGSGLHPICALVGCMEKVEDVRAEASGYDNEHSTYLIQCVCKGEVWSDRRGE